MLGTHCLTLSSPVPPFGTVPWSLPVAAPAPTPPAFVRAAAPEHPFFLEVEGSPVYAVLHEAAPGRTAPPGISPLALTELRESLKVCWVTALNFPFVPIWGRADEICP